MVDAQQHFREDVLVVGVGVCAVLDLRECLEGLQEVVGKAAAEQREILVAVTGVGGQRAQHLNGGDCRKAFALVCGRGGRKFVGVIRNVVLPQLLAEARCEHLARWRERLDAYAVSVTGDAQRGTQDGHGLEPGTGSDVGGF